MAVLCEGGNTGLAEVKGGPARKWFETSSGIGKIATFLMIFRTQLVKETLCTRTGHTMYGSGPMGMFNLLCLELRREDCTSSFSTVCGLEAYSTSSRIVIELPSCYKTPKHTLH